MAALYLHGMNDMNHDVIVADIGGTHARFACIDLDQLRLEKIAVYACSDFPCISHALMHYRDQSDLRSLEAAAIAIACPVLDDVVYMTNLHWNFSIKTLKKKLKLQHLEVINDFTAQAMSLLALKENEIIQIGQGTSDPKQTRVILGAGTGLGVAQLISTPMGYMPLAGEGGHTSWAAQNEQEWFIQCYLMRQYGHVSRERLISGAGLEHVYQAIAAYQGLDARALRAPEIAHLALSGQSPLAEAAIAQFFACLGAYAGDLALIGNALGGVFITGGMVPKLLPLMRGSAFRERFEEKGRFRAFNCKIPSYVVTAQQPGLLGAGVYLKEKYHSVN